MNSLKKGEGVLLLNFEVGPGVPLLNFEGVPVPESWFHFYTMPSVMRVGSRMPATYKIEFSVAIMKK